MTLIHYKAGQPSFKLTTNELIKFIKVNSKQIYHTDDKMKAGVSKKQIIQLSLFASLFR